MEVLTKPKQVTGFNRMSVNSKPIARDEHLRLGRPVRLGDFITVYLNILKEYNKKQVSKPIQNP